MCGIVGVVDLKGLTYQHQKFFLQGLYADGLRGLHATGVAALTRKFKTQIYKRSLAAGDFIQLGGTDKILNRFTDKLFFLGHNRHATMGDMIDENAHPFQHGHITLVHNGSLKTQYQLEGNALFDVDSEVITHNFAKNGAEATISKLNGAFSLVWYDAESKSLNFVRNSERPMHYAMLNNSAFIFGSEPEMLRWLAGRNNLTIVKNEIHELPTANLMSLDLTAKEVNFSHKKVELYQDPYRKPYTPPKKEDKPPVKSDVIYLPKGRGKHGGQILNDLDLKIGETMRFVPSFWEKSAGVNRFGNLFGYLTDSNIPGHKPTHADCVAFSVNNIYDEGEEYEGTIVGAREIDGIETVILNPSSLRKARKLATPLKKESEEKEESTAEEETGTFLLGPNGSYIPLETWNRLTQCGCSQCSGNLMEEHHQDILWLSELTILCPECAKELDDWTNKTHH